MASWKFIIYENRSEIDKKNLIKQKKKKNPYKKSH